MIQINRFENWPANMSGFARFGYPRTLVNMLQLWLALQHQVADGSLPSTKTASTTQQTLGAFSTLLIGTALSWFMQKLRTKPRIRFLETSLQRGRVGFLRMF
jgi:hypothetical protein